MFDIMKMNKCLKDVGLLTKGINETIENEVLEQKGELIDMLLGTLVF